MKWPQSSLMVSGSASIPTSWNSALSSAANQWNGYPDANWTVNWYGVGYPGSVNVKMHKQSTAPGGYDRAPGLANLRWSGSTLEGGDIYFNSDFTWNLSGGMNQAGKYADVRTIAIHELGHEVYLNHPDQCGSMTTNEVLAAMNPNWFKKWFTNTDDIAGLQFRR